MTSIHLKRIYDPPSPDDGFRVLVDRLWPRGMSKEHAAIDLWAKDVAPSTELRHTFDHQAPRWEDFRHEYAEELTRTSALDDLRAALRPHDVATFLFAAKDTEHNNAVALREILDGSED